MVLILVVVEDGLGEFLNVLGGSPIKVLILVVVEDGLGEAFIGIVEPQSVLS